MTATATEQNTAPPSKDGKIDISLTLTPLIALGIDDPEDESPSALASYSQYAAQYLANVEQFVARNNVHGLKISGPVELEAADNRYRVTMSGVLDFEAGSRLEKSLRKINSQLAEAEDVPARANLTAAFDAWLAKYLADELVGYGYRFRVVAAEYQGVVGSNAGL